MTDRERFLALLEALRQALETLTRYQATIPRERLLAELDTQNMVLFALYRAIQAAVDVGQHLIAERGLPVPSSYREVFTVLGTSGVLDGGLAGRLQGWGGLRNLIAHQYGALNLELVAHALYQELGDLRDFATAMAGLAAEDT